MNRAPHWAAHAKLLDGPYIDASGCKSETQARIIAEGLKGLFPCQRVMVVEITYDSVHKKWDRKETIV